MGMPIKEYQEHEGAKDASTLYVGYNYDTTASSGEYTAKKRGRESFPEIRVHATAYGTGPEGRKGREAGGVNS